MLDRTAKRLSDSGTQRMASLGTQPPTTSLDRHLLPTSATLIPDRKMQTTRSARAVASGDAPYPSRSSNDGWETSEDENGEESADLFIPRPPTTPLPSEFPSMRSSRTSSYGSRSSTRPLRPHAREAVNWTASPLLIERASTPSPPPIHIIDVTDSPGVTLMRSVDTATATGATDLSFQDGEEEDGPSSANSTGRRPSKAVIMKGKEGQLREAGFLSRIMKSRFALDLEMQASPPSDEPPVTPGADPELQTAWRWKLLLNYGQFVLVALVIAAFAFPIIVGVSHLPWSDDTFYKAQTGYGTTKPYLNSPMYAILSAVTFITSLVLFVVIQFWSMYGWKRWKESRIGVVGIVVSIGVVLVMLGLWRSEMAYYWWYGDAFLLLITYVTMTLSFGYLGAGPFDEAFTKAQVRRLRLTEALVFTVSEGIVAVSAVVYGIWLMPVYASLSTTGKLFWRALFHPLYFELLCMTPCHLLIAYRTKRRWIDVLQTLTIAHGQAHMSTMATAMLTELGSWQEVLLGAFVHNLARYASRQTVLLRDRFVCHLFKVPFDVNQQKYLRSMELQIEVVMDTSANLFAPYMVYAFLGLQNTFMLGYAADNMTTDTLIEAIVFSVGVGTLFDLVYMFTNTNHLQHLPLLKVWGETKPYRFRFNIFLIFSMITMGLLVLLWLTVRVPRAVMCSSDDPCTCYALSPECLDPVGNYTMRAF
ncbi:hypothetical protein HKX48_004014 [Thoreauomyces humboldtii]|nr:hypothetical protein HKX48_004014 [Thoreauomyces humboldtii]